MSNENIERVELESAEVSENEVTGVAKKPVQKQYAVNVDENSAESDAPTPGSQPLSQTVAPDEGPTHAVSDPGTLGSNNEAHKTKYKTNAVVVTTSNFSCKVGPKWYTFKKGVKYTVPENVKIILKRAGKLGVI